MKLPPSRGSPGDLDEVARGGTRINVVNRQPEGGKRGWETMVDGQAVVTRMMTNSLCVMRTRAVAYAALDVARLYSTLIRLGVKKYGIIGKDRMYVNAPTPLRFLLQCPVSIYHGLALS